MTAMFENTPSQLCCCKWMQLVATRIREVCGVTGHETRKHAAMVFSDGGVES